MSEPPRSREPPSHYHISLAESPGNTQALSKPQAVVEETHDSPKTRSPALLPVIIITSPKSPSLPPTRPRKRRAPSSDIYLEPELEIEAPGRKRKMPSKKHSSSEKHSSKHKPKSDDWADVTEPEERRRIQNRIAQRKFREKAKEQKERAERETRDQEHADSSYRIADPRELGDEDGDLSGLPWGGLNVRHAIARGHHETEEHRSRHSPDDGYDYHSSSNYGGGVAQYHQQQQQQQQQQHPDHQYSGSVAGDSGASGDYYYQHQQQYQQQQTPNYGSGDSTGDVGAADDGGRYYDDQQTSYSCYYHHHHPDPNAGE